MGGTTPPDGAGGLGELIEAVGTPAELAALLDADGVDDAVIGRFAEEIGAAAVLDRLFTLMAARFVPAKAGSGRGAVQWNVAAPGGPHAYRLLIGDGRAEAGRGAPDSPKVTLSLTLPDLLRLCAGRLDGVTGVLTGKIKISGDMLFGAKLQGWFDYS